MLNLYFQQSQSICKENKKRYDKGLIILSPYGHFFSPSQVNVQPSRFDIPVGIIYLL